MTRHAPVFLALSATVAMGVTHAPRPSTVSGRVTFTGTPPAAPAIDMSSEAYCHGARTPARNPIAIGEQNGLAQVVVYVRNAPSSSAPVPTEPVTLDQHGCLYVPNVVALRVGQPFVIRNSDQVLHNVHGSPKKNAPFNVGQPSAGLQAKRTFRTQEIGIPVRCDIHDWMEASVAVFDHPFFAVTASDGKFAISDLPPGEYELVAWHPKLGERVQRVRVGDGAAEVNFSFTQ